MAHLHLQQPTASTKINTGFDIGKKKWSEEAGRCNLSNWSSEKHDWRGFWPAAAKRQQHLEEEINCAGRQKLKQAVKSDHADSPVTTRSDLKFHGAGKSELVGNQDADRSPVGTIAFRSESGRVFKTAGLL